MEEEIEKRMKQFYEDFTNFLSKNRQSLRRHFPNYSGKNLAAWITEMEICFDVNGVIEEYKLSVAMAWLQIWRITKPCQNWSELKMEILREAMSELIRKLGAVDQKVAETDLDGKKKMEVRRPNGADVVLENRREAMKKNMEKKIEEEKEEEGERICNENMEEKQKEYKAEVEAVMERTTMTIRPPKKEMREEKKVEKESEMKDELSKETLAEGSGEEKVTQNVEKFVRFGEERKEEADGIKPEEEMNDDALRSPEPVEEDEGMVAAKVEGKNGKDGPMREKMFGPWNWDKGKESDLVSIDSQMSRSFVPNSRSPNQTLIHFFIQTLPNYSSEPTNPSHIITQLSTYKPEPKPPWPNPPTT